MKIEPGKEYRCRNGSRARIYWAYEPNHLEPHGEVHGVIVYSESSRSISMWNIDGSYHGGKEHHLDLISEWKETVKSYCYRHKDGAIMHRDNETGKFLSKDWQRFPAGDLEGEVE